MSRFKNNRQEGILYNSRFFGDSEGITGDGGILLTPYEFFQWQDGDQMLWQDGEQAITQQT